MNCKTSPERSRFSFYLQKLATAERDFSELSRFAINSAAKEIDFKLIVSYSITFRVLVLELAVSSLTADLAGHFNEVVRNYRLLSS